RRGSLRSSRISSGTCQAPRRPEPKRQRRVAWPLESRPVLGHFNRDGYCLPVRQTWLPLQLNGLAVDGSLEHGPGVGHQKLLSGPIHPKTFTLVILTNFLGIEVH